jgi:hypothetical protein
LEKRAAAAALCEPDLLRNHSVAEGVLHILDSITASLSQVEDRKYEDFKTLRNGLGYCWSVAVVACPDPGKDFIERWIDSPDKDIRWVMKQNLKKKRLERMDAGWVARQLARIDDSATAA